MTSRRPVLIDEGTGRAARARVMEERMPALVGGLTRAAVSASGEMSYSRERLQGALGRQRAGHMPAQLMPKQNKMLLFVFDDLWGHRSLADGEPFRSAR